MKVTMLPFLLTGKMTMIADPVLGQRVRVACVRSGIVQEILVADSAKLSGLQELYEAVIVLREDQACNIGWSFTPPADFQP